MSHRLSQNARHTNDLLEELERDKELEVLREYLTRFALFPRQRDPAAAPIRFEELKELVKHWKLHRQRNFWKTHTTKDDLVRTLYRHINTKIIPQEARDEGVGLGVGSVGNGAIAAQTNNAPTQQSHVGGVVPIAPTAPARKASSVTSSGAVESPRSKSILVHARGSPSAISGSGPKREHIFSEYSGDLFSQRGDYEDGMIYLSRFQKPGVAATDAAPDTRSNSASDLAATDAAADAQDVHAASHDELDVGSAQLREVRLKQECAFSIYHYSADVGHERQMVTEGCMLALSRLSVVDDLDVKKLCAAAILNLTFDATLSARLLDDGVLLALLELAKAQHEEIRRNTSLALCRLSYDHTGQQRLVHEGCVSAIISMLNAPDDATKEACVKALINIASTSGAAVAESVVHAVVRLASRNDPTSAAFAAAAMCNLSLLAGPRTKVVDDGILDSVRELTQPNSVTDVSVPVQLDVATALANFSGCTANLEALSHARVLESLEDLLKIDDDDVLERCAFTLANLSMHGAALKTLAHSDAAVQLVDLGARASPSVQESIALSLANLSATAESRQLVGRGGVAALLLHFLTDAAATTRTQQFAVVSLCRLVGNPVTCAELMQRNAPTVFARLATTAPHDSVRALGAHALSTLSSDVALHAFLLKDDVVRAIARLCRRLVVTAANTVEPAVDDVVGANDKTPIVLDRSQESALACLYNLSFGGIESRKALLRVDVVATLVQLFQRPVRNDEQLRQCAAVVANLSFDADARARMVDDGVVRLVRKLMSASSTDALQCCATACCNLAADALDRTPVLAMLIDLSASPHAPIPRTCALAFAKLASAATSRPALAKCSELYPALTLLMRCGIDDIQIYSAVALCNLATERRAAPASRHIWRDGTVPDFIVNALLRINSESTKEICARALYNLLTHDDARAGHIKDGVLYALVKLARLESVEIRGLCVAALYNLSCDATMRDVLLELNVAQVIAKLCELACSSQDLHRRLATCLMNLATSKPETALRLVDSGALAATLALAEHNDPPTLRACAAVLCALSAHRSSCEAIVATAGLLNVLVRMVDADDAPQHVLALHALCNIACVPSLHVRLIDDAKAVAPLVTLFGAATDDSVLLACAQTLYNLAADASGRHALRSRALFDVLTLAHARRPLAAPLVTICVQLVAVLCEDDSVGSDYMSDLAANGAVRVLRALAPHCDAATMLHAVFALGQLARSDGAALVVLTDGAIDVLASAVLPPETIAITDDATDATVDMTDAPVVTPELGERCTIILRSLSTSGACVAALSADTRLLPIVHAVTTATANGETCKHAVLLLYNVTAACQVATASLDALVAAGVVRVLIRLASVSGTDMAPVCAIALAHIKHIQTDRDESTSGTSDAQQPPDALDDGLVTALLAMIDLDPASIQRVDRLAAALPANLPPLRPATWHFFSGDSSLRLVAPLPVSWTVHNAAVDDARFVPPEPQTFLSLLTPTAPATGVAVQDRLVGAFVTMRVHADKCRVQRVDPKLLPAVTTRESERLADAIAFAVGGSGQDATASQSDSDDDDDDMDEVRAPSPVKKKQSSGPRGAIVRAGSYGRSISAFATDRRSSKSNNIAGGTSGSGTGSSGTNGTSGVTSSHKNSKALLLQDSPSNATRASDASLRKKESQRNSKLFSDSDRSSVVLPRL